MKRHRVSSLVAGMACLVTTRAFPVTFVLVVGVFLTLVSWQTAQARAAMPRQAQAPESQGLPDAPGKALVERACIVCHGFEYLVPSVRTVSQWRDVLAVMRQYGAQASDEEWKAMTEYIAANIAYLSMNKATAEEIRLVFGVSEKIAQNVVAYRDKEGSFKTIEDLKNVPDLDPKAIDALKARLTFVTD